MIRFVLALLLLGVAASFAAPEGSLSPSGGGWSVVVSSSDVADTAVSTYSNVPGLGIAVAANTNYLINCRIVVSADASTTGVWVGMTGPASPTAVTTRHLTFTAASAVANQMYDSFSSGTTSLHQPATSAGTTRLLYAIEMVLRNGANAGTVNPIIDLETAAAGGTANAHTGSWCEYRAF